MIVRSSVKKNPAREDYRCLRCMTKYNFQSLWNAYNKIIPSPYDKTHFREKNLKSNFFTFLLPIIICLIKLISPILFGRKSRKKIK